LFTQLTAILAILLLPTASTTQPRLSEAESVVIVVNEAMAGSVELGRYYARRRGIPAGNICRLRTSTRQTVGRREFRDKIRAPLRHFLLYRRLLVEDGDRRTVRVRYIVPVYGVPLRIAPEGAIPVSVEGMKNTDAAAVDAELALVVRPRAPKPEGVVANPYFRRIEPFGECRMPEGGRLVSEGMTLVTRLDGPSVDIVRRMIDDASRAEVVGLKGRAYFDLSLQRHGYVEGDRWLKRARSLWEGAGYATDVEATRAVFPDSRPMPDPAVYMGWYAFGAYGRFRNPAFRFARGAIACHIHSFSAADVRSEEAHWVGPLLARGATVTLGNVYEPLLSRTSHLDILTERLLAGGNFAEAAYASIPYLSWQTVFLGDPLYRPFRKPTATTRPAGG